MKKRCQKPKVCLLGASFNTNNMGVRAITAGIIKSILHQFPNADIILLDYGTDNEAKNIKLKDRTYQCRVVNMRFSKRFYLKNNIAFLILLSLSLRVIPVRAIRNTIISKNRCLDHIVTSDIIASVAGGDSLSDIYGLKRFLYVSLPQLLVLFLQKKLVLLPQTLGPFRGMISKILVKYIFNGSQAIYSRDFSGMQERKSCLVPKIDSEKIRFCYDVGFVLDSIKSERIHLDDFFEDVNRRSPLVGLNISGLLFVGGYKQNNMFGLKINYGEFIYELIKFLIEKKKLTVLLIPHVFGSMENVESDAVVCERMYSQLKNRFKEKLFLVRGYYDQNEIKYIIGLCDFFIGSRMHACIAALSQNIPAVAIAYSKKFYGVFETIGVERFVADPRKLKKEEIFEITEEGYNQRDLIRKHLESKMPLVKEKVLNLFKEISSIVSS